MPASVAVGRDDTTGGRPHLRRRRATTMIVVVRFDGRGLPPFFEKHCPLNDY
jgi:hypothetical protein